MIFGPLENVGSNVLYYGRHPNTRMFLRLIAAYGIIQVVAQDLGVKTNKAHSEVVTSEPVLALLLFSNAFTVTDNFVLAFISTSLYYFLKYYASIGQEKDTVQ